MSYKNIQDHQGSQRSFYEYPVTPKRQTCLLSRGNTWLLKIIWHSLRKVRTDFKRKYLSKKDGEMMPRPLFSEVV